MPGWREERRKDVTYNKRQREIKEVREGEADINM